MHRNLRKYLPAFFYIFKVCKIFFQVKKKHLNVRKIDSHSQSGKSILNGIFDAILIDRVFSKSKQIEYIWQQ